MSPEDPTRIGVLALQGDFREHLRAFERVGAEVREVRGPEHLNRLHGVVIPGGESSTITKLMRVTGLDLAVSAFHAAGGGVWGTCAGTIVMAKEIEGHPEQPRLGLLDLAVARNAYGRQVASFESDLSLGDLHSGGGSSAPFRGIFIRAPRILRVGEGVEVLARERGDPVAVRDGRSFATVFHPELGGDDRFHQMVLDRWREHRSATTFGG